MIFFSSQKQTYDILVKYIQNASQKKKKKSKMLK